MEGSLWQLGVAPVGTAPYDLTIAASGQGFVYVNSETLTAVHEPVVLRSRSFLAPGINSMLSFSYRAYGSGVASLSLFAEKLDGTRYLLWAKHGGTRDWINEEVNLCLAGSHSVRNRYSGKASRKISVERNGATFRPNATGAVVLFQSGLSQCTQKTTTMV